MENFAWDWTVLESLTSHVQTGEKLPRQLFEKMLAAKNFQSAMAMVRQLEFGLFDMLLHTQFNAQKDSILDLLNNVRKEVAVTQQPAYNRFANSFSHIFAGGYAAGYYSYKWAEVLAADAFGRFEEEGLFTGKAGAEFRDCILAVGGAVDPMKGFVAFRGRKPTVDALLRQSGISTEESESK